MWRQAQQNTCRYIHYFSSLYSGGNQKTLQPSSRISLWKVTSSKAKVSHITFSYLYPSCCLQDKEKNNNQPELEIKLLIWD
ncbi:hypothetical protein COP1_002608 [Malus domestica]